MSEENANAAENSVADSTASSAPSFNAGLVGKKLGMTRVFTDTASLAVTVVAVDGNRIAQVKRAETDGYTAAQVAFGSKAVKNISAPSKGHLAKHKAGAAARLCEFRCGEDALDNAEPGQALPATVFAEGQLVDVTGWTKGKGFAGVIKRHHFRSNRASHGNSRAHRKPGSTGQCQDPGRTFPGKKMPGRLGGKRRTLQNLQIVRVDAEHNVLLIRGAIPGAPGGYVVVRRAVHSKG